MDPATVAVILISAFALVLLVGFLLVRKIKGSIKIPGIGRIDVEASKEPSAPPTAASVEEVESGGKAEAVAEGGPASVRKTKADGDVRAVSTQPKEGDESKKA